MEHPFGRNFSLGHLATFMAVVRHGRIASACEEMRRSASAVSRSIAMLEERLGRPLLNRAQSGITPTPEGELVAARCRIIQNEFAGLRGQLMQEDGTDLYANASTFQMHVDASRLRALIAVQEFGSVQRAGQALAISQPAVSTSIRHLEADIGIELFSRTPAGMIATPAGVAATLCARRVLGELRRMKDDVDSHDGAPSGLVCVGGLAFSRSALLPEAIKRTLAGFPQINIRTVEGPIRALVSGMHAGEIDFLICAQPNPALLDGVAVEPIVQDPMQLYVSKDHPLAGRSSLDAEELLAHPFILPPAGSVTRDMLDEVFRRETGRKPAGAVETSSYSVIRYLLLNAGEISFRSVMEFHADMPSGLIVPLDLAFPLPSRSICLLQRQDAHPTAAVSRFLDIVRDVPKQEGKP